MLGSGRRDQRAEVTRPPALTSLRLAFRHFRRSSRLASVANLRPLPSDPNSCHPPRASLRPCGAPQVRPRPKRMKLAQCRSDKAQWFNHPVHSLIMILARIVVPRVWLHCACQRYYGSARTNRSPLPFLVDNARYAGKDGWLGIRAGEFWPGGKWGN